MVKANDNSFARLLAVITGRSVPIRDATGARRFVSRSKTPDARTRTLIVGLLILTALISLIVTAVSLAKGNGWKESVVAGGVAFGITGLVTFSSTLLADPEKHVRLWIGRGLCPWCFAELRPPDEEDIRVCTQCEGRWWDVPGVMPGDSKRRHTEHRIAFSAMSALVGLGFGFVAFTAASAGPVRSFVVGELCVVGVYAVMGFMFGAGGAHPLSVGGSAMLIPIGLGLFWLRGANANNSMAMIVFGTLLGVLGGLGASAASRLFSPRAKKGEGRVCADCGYDLRRTGLNLACPECGSHRRIR